MDNIDILKRMILDDAYYGVHAQLSHACYRETLNLDTDALRVLIAHYDLQRINRARPAWLDPEPFDMPTPPRRSPEDMRE